MSEAAPLSLAPLLERIRPVLAGELPVYLVGGAVRDALLGRISPDLDFVVPRDAVRLTFRVADALKAPAYVLDGERDTGRVVLIEQKIMLDFACFRGPDLEADLRARDFTINSLAIPVMDQSRAAIIDPTGGLQDIEDGLVRLTHQGAIDDDPVRTLRAVRLAVALGFTITAETKSAVISAVPMLSNVSRERIRDELLKIIMTSRPGDALLLLQELDLLQAILPEVAALSALDQSPPHFEDVLAHTRRVLERLVQLEAVLFSNKQSDDPALTYAQSQLKDYLPFLLAHFEQPVDGGLTGFHILRLAALYHDVGKKETHWVEEDGRIRFFGHDAKGAELTAIRLHELCLSKNVTSQVKHIVAGHMRPLSLVQAQGSNPSRRAVYRYFQASGENGLDVGLLAMADHLATHNGPGEGQTWPTLVGLVKCLYQHYFEKHEEAVKPPPLLNGRDLIDLLGMEPGQEFGRILRLVEENQAAGEINNREEALQFVRLQFL
jgi:poly(A) polymerase